MFQTCTTKECRLCYRFLHADIALHVQTLATCSSGILSDFKRVLILGEGSTGILTCHGDDTRGDKQHYIPTVRS